MITAESGSVQRSGRAADRIVARPDTFVATQLVLFAGWMVVPVAPVDIATAGTDQLVSDMFPS